MTSILAKVAEFYKEELTAKAEKSDSCAFFSTFFQDIQKDEISAAVNLICSLKEVLPAAAVFVDEKANLQTDRAMAASALSYLIMPVDLIPDEGTGLAGYLDDALLIFLVLRHLEAPHKEIASWVNSCSADAGILLSGLPGWFLDSVERFSADIISQVEAMKSAWQLAEGARL